jgi:hypothetical protein
VSANVRSIPALADFRAALTTFGDSARRALEEVRMEVQRGVSWVSDEQPKDWKSEQQRSWDLVAEKRNELDQCERRSLDGQRPSCYQERKALEAAKRYVRFVEDKIDQVRGWGRRLVTEVSEYEGQVGRFYDMLEIEVPKAVALLDRLIISLEGYTSVAAGQLTATLGQEPQSIVRDTPELEAPPTISVFQQLREFTPKQESREAVVLPPPDQLEARIAALKLSLSAATGHSSHLAPRDDLLSRSERTTLIGEARNDDDVESEVAADEASCQQAALKTAYDLQLEPALPGWDDKVVLIAGCLAEAQVFLERVKTPAAGDSGWFIGLVEPELGAPPRYEALPLSALIELRPPLLAACALPPGYLAVFSHDELVAVLDAAGTDLWEQHLRSVAEEKLKDQGA